MCIRDRREIVPAYLTQFSFAWSGPAKHSLYVPKDGRWVLSCAYRIRMLVEPHVTSFEKLFEPITVTERVETAGPADENIFP